MYGRQAYYRLGILPATTMSSFVMLLFCLSCLVSGYLCSPASMKVIDGALTHVIDNCDPSDPNSCGHGKCCVKQGMSYIPEATGPKPSFVIQCQSLRAEGHYCYRQPSYLGMCPCADGLTCEAGSFGFFGHCH